MADVAVLTQWDCHVIISWAGCDESLFYVYGWKLLVCVEAKNCKVETVFIS